MKKKNDKVKSVIVLTVICLLVTAVLAVTNSFTYPIITAAREKKIEESLKAVIPDMYSIRMVDQLPEGTPSTVKAVYIVNDEKYAVVLAATSAYSSGDMGITVGIADGELIGVKLTSYFESKDFGKETYPLTYLGATKDSYSDVDTFSGVTYSSKAFKKAIGDAFTVIALIEGGEAN